MARKLAVKRLTASDLTLFKWHFRNNPAVKQKAFNLDADVLVGDFYPQLSEPSAIPQPRYPVDLYLVGPGGKPAHNLQRKILKQQKNWRLNGELIDDPDEQPGRYDVLRPGDYALIELSGDVVPTTAQIILVAKGDPEDIGLHAILAHKYPDGAMSTVSEEEIVAIVGEAKLPETHPLQDWINDGVVEDAVLGGAKGVALLSRRGSKGLTPEEFLRRRLAAERTGVSGEEHVNDYLEEQKAAGLIGDFEWVSSLNAVAPFDFQISASNSETRLVDVKSTSGPFSNPLHMSYGEIVTALNGNHSYDIYRAYNVSDAGCELRVAYDVGRHLQPILDAVGALPIGVKADSFSIDPDLLQFNPGVVHLGRSEVRSEGV